MNHPELELAEAFVEETDRHVFLTGKAGTGKTTFLHTLRAQSRKRMIVTAPTGVAAINARGVTLHSFFQLPLGPWIAGRDALEGSRSHRFSREKRRLVENLELLVIDEISMVRSDVLDGVDATLRRLRRSDLPFGGVQLLMIGDLGQLAPIVRDDEQEILRQLYDTPYFFSSQALRQTEWLTLELQTVYRQTDPHFIELLNRVREGRLDRSTLDQLHARHRPGFVPPEGEGWITLATHNRTVDALNESRLERLPGTPRRFEAEIEGDFPLHSAPAPELLELKVGAQVLFVRNDPSPQKLYFNGKIGKVTRLEREKVHVRCPEDPKDIEVEPATWDNVTYHLDEASGEVRETKIGSFRQLPLKLAWAITIHKSQGLTFERAVIEAGAAFAAGQVYVALSRCRSFEGVVLASPIQAGSVRTDEAVQRFLDGTGAVGARRADPEILERARLESQWRLLREVFGFEALRRHVVRLLDLLREHANVLRVIGVDDPAALAAKIDPAIFEVSEKFLRELDRHAARKAEPTSDALLLERIGKASEYFRREITEGLVPLTRARVETDNRDLRRRAKEALDRVGLEVAGMLAALETCAHGFSTAEVRRARTSATLTAERGRSRREAPLDAAEAGIEHGELLERLLRWRAEEARRAGDVLPHQILRQSVILGIARDLPTSRTALRRIDGVGKKTVQKHGDALLEVVTTYCRERGLEQENPPGTPPSGGKSVKGASSRQSFERFQAGASIAAIAAERGLAVSTIEGHLASFVASGQLAIDAVLAPERRRLIEAAFDAMPEMSLSDLKAAMIEEVSYGELRLVEAHREFLEQRGGRAEDA